MRALVGAKAQGKAFDDVVAVRMDSGANGTYLQYLKEGVKFGSWDRLNINTFWQGPMPMSKDPTVFHDQAESPSASPQGSRLWVQAASINEGIDSQKWSCQWSQK